MVKTKPAEDWVKNYKRAIPRVAQAYSDGIDDATGVIQASIDAEELWAEKMQAAIAARSREKGLEQVSDADWKKASKEKGAVRIGAGMAAAESKFRAAAQHNASVIQGVDIPPRTSDPMQNLIARAGPIVQALAEDKRQRKGL